MSWMDDLLSKAYKGVGNAASSTLNGVGDVAKFFGPQGAAISKAAKSGSEFYQNELSNKSDLRASEVLGFGSGFPILGDVIRGIQGVNQMEDLYDRTGKTSAYSGLQNLGSGGFGSAAGQALRIADGSNDLYRYYAGEPDQWTINLYG